MTNTSLPTLGFILKAREDVAAFTQLLAESFNPDFFSPPNGPPRVLLVALNGTQKSWKSALADDATHAFIPSSKKSDPISGFNNPELAGKFNVREGASKYGHLKISYQEMAEDSYHDRLDDAGVHFFQNVAPRDIPNLDIHFEVRLPDPFDPLSAHAEILNDIEIEKDEETGILPPENELQRQQYDFLRSEHLPNLLLRRSFARALRDACGTENPKPRLLLMTVHNPELLKQPGFRSFYELLREYQDNPTPPPSPVLP